MGQCGKWRVLLHGLLGTRAKSIRGQEGAEWRGRPRLRTIPNTSMLSYTLCCTPDSMGLSASINGHLKVALLIPTALEALIALLNSSQKLALPIVEFLLLIESSQIRLFCPQNYLLSALTSFGISKRPWINFTIRRRLSENSIPHKTSSMQEI